MEGIKLLYQDNRVLVCVKPAGIRSTDEPGGLPDLLRRQLVGAGENICLRTVHRLDQVVGGVMVLARSREAARRLSAQVEGRAVQKTYLAVVEGTLPPSGQLRDLLTRDKRERKTHVTDQPGPDAREAVLDFRALSQADGLTLAEITLHTGRTHQIRAQLSAHFGPIWGDRKYGSPRAGAEGIGLWSYAIGFQHPQTGEALRFSAPPSGEPWGRFDSLWTECDLP